MRLFFAAALFVSIPALTLAQTTQPGALNETLLKMPGNTWLKLPVTGTAKARMYSGACFGGGRMWYFGGAHSGYKGNDVELFDPRTLTWTQASEAEWPEVGSEDWKLMVGGGGTTKHLSPKGAPFTEHTYQQACWQPDRKRFFVVLVSSGTWEFDPAAGKWTHLINKFANEKPDPRGSWAQNQVVYEPTLKAPVLIVGTGNADRYQFVHEKREWKKLGPTPEKLKWAEPYLTYVTPWRAFLASTSKGGWFRFDVATGELAEIESPEELKGCQSLAYDERGRAVIALAREKVDKYTQTVQPWALDVATVNWTRLDPPRPWPRGQCTGNWAKLWYDPEHNVHLFINDVKRDRQQMYDGGVTETWAFRYAPPATQPSGE